MTTPLPLVHHTGVTLLGAPTDVGAGVQGSALAPHALRLAGLASRLAQAGVNVVDRGDLQGPDRPPDLDQAQVGPPLHHLNQVIAWNQTVHDAVLAELQQDRLPVLLGGDHSLAIGSISAVARYCRQQGKALRVIWLDAHADFNTAASSPSGNIHGMPVACLCGEGPQGLTTLAGVSPALTPDQVTQLGVRSVDATEALRILARGLKIYSMADIRAQGIAKVMELALAGIDANTHLHVSFDVDFLDPLLAPGVGTPAAQGPTLAQSLYCIDRLAACAGLGSVDVVELNPRTDKGTRTTELVATLLTRLLNQKPRQQ
ncbi:MAG: arginase [Burkholderiaceae bacterium]|nr:arginase [Burkholderiaceae bacterium]